MLGLRYWLEGCCHKPSILIIWIISWFFYFVGYGIPYDLNKCRTWDGRSPMMHCKFPFKVQVCHYITSIELYLKPFSSTLLEARHILYQVVSCAHKNRWIITQLSVFPFLSKSRLEFTILNSRYVLHSSEVNKLFGANFQWAAILCTKIGQWFKLQ